MVGAHRGGRKKTPHRRRLGGGATKWDRSGGASAPRIRDWPTHASARAATTAPNQADPRGVAKPSLPEFIRSKVDRRSLRSRGQAFCACQEATMVAQDHSLG